MIKKIFSIIVSVSFLLNTTAYADGSVVRDRSNASLSTLSPESRLSSIDDNSVMLDIMKLTAEIVALGSREDIALRERTDILNLRIDEVDNSTGIDKKVYRPGEEILFNFRTKVIQGDVIFIPCSITTPSQDEAQEDKTRHYLCVAKKTQNGKYEYDIIPSNNQDLNGTDVYGALRNSALLAAIAKKSRPDDVKQGIARFVGQQEVDRTIRKAILDGKETRLILGGGSYIDKVADFLTINEFKVAGSFVELSNLGQVMVIPGLSVPHAGGIGIYLPNSDQYKNAETLIHEIFAKCGLSHTEADVMVKIYNKFGRNERLNSDEAALLDKAKQADFANRYDDVLNIDFYKDGFQVDMGELRGNYGRWFLGIDSSTKSVKFVLIEWKANTQRIIWTHTESFNDSSYKDFGTRDGVIPHPQAPEQYHTDPLMIASALDNGMSELAKQLKDNELSLANIKAISGAGQQHGTVYLNENAQRVLSFSEPQSVGSDPLWRYLDRGNMLASPTSPIWQDGSTQDEVGAINEAAGGKQAVRQTTGSEGTRRFSLAQVLAVFNRQPAAARNTKTILNIAAWNGALLTGMADFPWDPGDALGTNAAKAKEKVWWGEFLDRLSPGLRSKFSHIKPSDSSVGKLSKYWTTKYGFSPETQVVNWTGDNPSGLTGMGVIEEGEIVVSLGTSYTMYTFVGGKGLDQALKTPIGHIFGEPTGQYMNLVCFQNGDDTLRDVREKYIPEAEAIERARKDGMAIPQNKEELAKLVNTMRLEIFTEELSKTAPGNNGAMMVAMHKTEDVVKIPFVDGKTYSRGLNEKDRAQVFRAKVEGQVYFLKWVAGQIGLDVKKIKLTGGVSNNPVVRQIMADVFNAEISVLAVSEAVAIGSAIRAMKVGRNLTWQEAIKNLTAVDKAQTVVPDRNNVATYESRYGEFKTLLEQAIKDGENAPAAKPAEVKTSAPVPAGAETAIFPDHPVVTVVGSIVADIIVPLGAGSDYPEPSEDSGLVGKGDKVFRTPPASATKAYLDSLNPTQRERMTITYGGPACASAFTAHELGAKVKLVCAVGDDEIGRGLIALMKRKGMDTSGVKVVPNVSTSTNLIFSNKDTGDTAYNLALEGANEHLLEADIKDQDLEGVAALHLGGIALNPKLMDSLSTLIDRAKKKDVKIGWDTVVDLYGKEKAATELMGKVDYMTPSMKEAVRISGKGSVEENMAFFRDLGVRAVFLKNGENGNWVYTSKDGIFGEDTQEHVPAATVVGYEDSTGAGDSYSAFVTCAAASGWTPIEAARGASVCGALTCERRGGASITETPEEAYARKMASYEIERARREATEPKFGTTDTGVAIRGENAVTLNRALPAGAEVTTPQIVSATVAPNAGMNLISLKVLFPGQAEPTEMLTTASPEELAEFFAKGEGNQFEEHPFFKAGAVIGPAPNRSTGTLEDGKIKVTFPNGQTTLVQANREGNTVPRYHLHGFFHMLEQRAKALVTPGKSAVVEGTVDVKGMSEEWPWPADSNITTRRAVTKDNKATLTVTQRNTGKEKTWASWLDHSYFKHPLGMKRGDVRLKLPAESMTPIGRTADGKLDYKDCLPTGEVKGVAGTEYDFTQPEGKPLGNVFLDDSFTSLIKQPDGSVIVEVLYPEIGYKLRIRAYDKLTRKDGTIETGNIKAIHVFSPDNSDFVCVEIGAHLNNPFDVKTWKDRDTGMVALNPGDAYEYNYEVEYLPIGAETAERITDLTPFSQEELKSITQKGTIEETPVNARRLAASYIAPGTREEALRAIKALKKNERNEFVGRVAKEGFNVLNRRARPESPNLPVDKIEQATFGLYAPDDFESFAEFGASGLLLETVVNFRAAVKDPNDPSGHTGKTLINLPWQFLPEHRHVDLVVLEKGAVIPEGWSSADTIPGFEGVLEYNPDGTPTGKILYAKNGYTIAVADSDQSKKPEGAVAYFPGKSETFNFISGSAILFGDKARMTDVGKVRGKLTEVPAELREMAEKFKREHGITAPDMMYAEAGAEVLLEKNTLHSLLALNDGVVYEEYSTPSRDEADLFTDRRIVRQPPAKNDDPNSQFPDGINASVIDIARAEAQEAKVVVFVSQDFASAARCKELMSAFPKAVFVPFNQHSQLGDLPAMLTDGKYAASRKVLVTLGLKADQMNEIVAANEAAFADVLPFNISAEAVDGLRGDRQKSFQKGVLTMGLLAAGIPQNGEYKRSRGYMVLKALLTAVFENADEAERYIENLVDPRRDMNVSERFGYLISRIIGPIQRLVVNEVARIVNIFA